MSNQYNMSYLLQYVIQVITIFYLSNGHFNYSGAPGSVYVKTVIDVSSSSYIILLSIENPFVTCGFLLAR